MATQEISVDFGTSFLLEDILKSSIVIGYPGLKYNEKAIQDSPPLQLMFGKRVPKLNLTTQKTKIGNQDTQKKFFNVLSYLIAAFFFYWLQNLSPYTKLGTHLDASFERTFQSFFN